KTSEEPFLQINQLRQKSPRVAKDGLGKPPRFEDFPEVLVQVLVMGGSLERCLCRTTPVQNREASVCPRFAPPLTLWDRGQERKGSTEQSEPFAPVTAPSLAQYAGWTRAGRLRYHRGRPHHACHVC